MDDDRSCTHPVSKDILLGMANEGIVHLKVNWKAPNVEEIKGRIKNAFCERFVDSRQSHFGCF